MYLRHAGRENEVGSGGGGPSDVKSVNMSFPASLLPYPFTISLQQKHRQL